MKQFTTIYEKYTLTRLTDWLPIQYRYEADVDDFTESFDYDGNCYFMSHFVRFGSIWLPQDPYHFTDDDGDRKTIVAVGVGGYGKCLHVELDEKAENVRLYIVEY